MDQVAGILTQWLGFEAAVAKVRLGDAEALREVNASLGYNVAKATPALIEEINRLDGALVRTRGWLGEAEEQVVVLRCIQAALNGKVAEMESANESLRQELSEFTAVNSGL